MTLWRHEWRQGRISLLVWTAAISFLIGICVLMFPQMQGQMQQAGEMFASMGSFTEAFGMDEIDFGTLSGFYAVECGNILGLGGAFFAALIASAALAKEEKDHTAEFLLTHPISRVRVLTEKWLAVVTQILVMNLVGYGVALGSVALIGEPLPLREITLLHTAYLLMQLELAGICFGISAFLRRGSVGVGLGMAAVMYFLNIIANLSDQAEFLKYITPFGYTAGADIVQNMRLDSGRLLLGMGYLAIGLVAAYSCYTRKDIA